MKLQEQVSNFELSKKLFNLGFKSEHNFTWIEGAEYDEEGHKIIAWHPVLILENNSDGVTVYCPENVTLNEDLNEIKDSKSNYPTYTSTELGKLLPKIIPHDLNNWSGGYYILFAYSEPTDPNKEREPSVWYEDNDLHDENMILHGTSGTTEADARAQMLIWLIENGKIIIDEEI